MIRISNLNVRGAHKEKLNEILRALEQNKWEVGVITETHLTGFHANGDKNYNIVASRANSPHQGGVALIWKKQSGQLLVEAPVIHGPNVISAFIITGKNRWLVVGTYLAPQKDPTLN